VIVNKNAYNKTLDFKVPERVDSDHLPLQLKIRRIEEENKEERREGKAEERRGRTKEIII